ncbi:PR-1-like protein [Pholiota conissans]|uniref:PR-1-like protein n=1 Tax=Pholiota conissans TaxID=109636 RepID=A0A9P5Z226_9AGAR|nr:PR-1-like protein [Pholiota conissans]
MARLSLFVCFALALSSFPGGALAGPACARKNFKLANCVSKCKSKWGWTGAMMNTDPWGSVVQKTDTDKNWDDVIAKACGVAVTSTPSSTGSASTALSTGTAIPAPAAAAGAQPTLTPSSISTISTLPLASATSSSTVTVATSTSSSTSKSSSRISNTKPSSIVSVQTLGLVAAPHSKSTTSARPVATTTRPTEQKLAPVSTKQAAPTTAAATPPPPQSDNSGSSGVSNSDIQAYLQAHNSVRAQHGAAPLTWNDNLSSKAQQWANNCVFKHSGGSLGPFGENLAAGTGSSYGISAAVKSWADEVSQYNPSNPVPSHFTQVVWKGTSEVGCAVQSCSGIFDASFGPAKFFVCEYSAQGNVIGQFAQNVQA